MIKWEYADHRPEGFECYSAKWGKKPTNQCELAVAKIGENRYTVWWYDRGITDIKKHIDADSWDDAKASAIAIVLGTLDHRAKYWRDMKIGFTNWISEE